MNLATRIKTPSFQQTKDISIHLWLPIGHVVQIFVSIFTYFIVDVQYIDIL